MLLNSLSAPAILARLSGTLSLQTKASVSIKDAFIKLLLVCGDPEGALEHVRLRHAAHPAHLAHDPRLAFRLLKRSSAVLTDHVQNGEGGLLLRQFDFLGLRALLTPVQHTFYSLIVSCKIQCLPSTDGDDVRHDGGQKQTDRQEGGQSTDEAVLLVIPK